MMVEKKGYIQARKKTFDKLVNTALISYENGEHLSITELADKSGISRATAYRYFPTQSRLISAIVERSLAPIFDWQSDEKDVVVKVNDFLDFALPQMLKHEGALRSALQLSLQQWATERATSLDKREKLVRGNRKEILSSLLEPIKSDLPEDTYQNMLYSLSVIYGSEMFIVLKDIWQLDDQKVIAIAQWMAKAIISQATNEILEAPGRPSK